MMMWKEEKKKPSKGRGDFEQLNSGEKCYKQNKLLMRGDTIMLSFS
jgi:hypothetical protein